MNLRPHGPQPCALPSYAIPRDQQMLLYQNFSKNQHFFRKFFGLEPKYFRKADEKDLIPLPEPLTYKDGAQVACGFGTVYEAIEKIGISGNHTVLVTGLGPVGLAALMLARAMGADKLIGVEMNDYRIDLVQNWGWPIKSLNQEKELWKRYWRLPEAMERSGLLTPAPMTRPGSWRCGVPETG